MIRLGCWSDGCYLSAGHKPGGCSTAERKTLAGAEVAKYPKTPKLKMDYIIEQKTICDRYGSPFFESPLHLKVGMSENTIGTALPIHGLRHKMEGDTTGWYIWAGEYSSDSDFFKPVHVKHLIDRCPQVLNYLGLAPGWRFLIALDYEDVWQDLSLLNTD